MEDFNLPSPERTILLEALHELVGNVPPYFWASCHTCDLESLEKLVNIARISPAAIRCLAPHFLAMILYWTQSSQGTSRKTTPNKTSTQSGLSSSSPGPSPTKKRKTSASANSLPLLLRNQKATALARERDGRRCVLTGEASVEVAHIFPFCRLKESENNIFGTRHMFWDQLKNFWPEEKVAAWQAKLFPRGLSESGIDQVDNRITLSKVAHDYWNRGAFALKPLSISADKSSLQIKFFWQKTQDGLQDTISLLTKPSTTENLESNDTAFESNEIFLRVTNTGNPWKSGQVFELRTDDTINKPLPNFELLELQWFLTRIVGIAGAAVPYEPGSGDDSDDDIPGLALDELEHKIPLERYLSDSLETVHKLQFSTGVAEQSIPTVENRPFLI